MNQTKTCISGPYCDDDYCGCDRYEEEQKQEENNNASKTLALAYNNMLQYLTMKKTSLFVLIITLLIIIFAWTHEVGAIDAKKGEFIGNPTKTSELYKVDDLKGGVVCYVMVTSNGGNTMSCLRYRN